MHAYAIFFSLFYHSVGRLSQGPWLQSIKTYRIKKCRKKPAHCKLITRISYPSLKSCDWKYISGLGSSFNLVFVFWPRVCLSVIVRSSRPTVVRLLPGSDRAVGAYSMEWASWAEWCHHRLSCCVWFAFVDAVNNVRWFSLVNTPWLSSDRTRGLSALCVHAGH